MGNRYSSLPGYAGGDGGPSSGGDGGSSRGGGDDDDESGFEGPIKLIINDRAVKFFRTSQFILSSVGMGRGILTVSSHTIRSGSSLFVLNMYILFRF